MRHGVCLRVNMNIKLLVVSEISVHGLALFIQFRHKEFIAEVDQV